MSTYNSPTDVVAGSLAKSADLNNLDAAVAAAFALLPTNQDLNSWTTNFAVDTGIANAYLVDLSTSPGSYLDGFSIVMKPINANTGACTINVNSIGVKAIKTESNTDPIADDFMVGVPKELRYSTTTGHFHAIQNSAAAALAAANSASSASTSASTATTQASAATSAAAAALVSENAAAANYDSFDDRYLGAKSSDPSLDNDGNALIAGALYFHTTSSGMKVYSGSAWLWIGISEAAGGASFNLKANGGLVVETGTIAVDLGASAITGTLAVGDGGTGVATSGTTGQIAVGGGTTSAIVWTTATGTGAPVRATSPTLVTPALGTPASGNLANCTGYPEGAAVIPSGTKMLFYADTAPTGWTIDNTLDDKVVYVTKGSAAGGQIGGAVHSAGTWTQPTHTHTGPSHAHSGPSHTHTGPSHLHNVYGNTVNNTEISALYATNGAWMPNYNHKHEVNINSALGGTGATGAEGTGSTGAEGTGATSAGATANTWRPAAYSMIICSKN